MFSKQCSSSYYACDSVMCSLIFIARLERLRNLLQFLEHLRDVEGMCQRRGLNVDTK